MKFLVSEHKALVEILEREGQDKDVAFVKRKGWVHVELSNRSFAFHREKYSFLSEDGFQQVVQYLVRYEDTELRLSSFDELAREFAIWLSRK